MGQRLPFSSSSKGTISSNSPGSANHVKNEAEVAELLKDRHVSDEPGLCPWLQEGTVARNTQKPFPIRAKSAFIDYQRALCFPPKPERGITLRNLPLQHPVP